MRLLHLHPGPDTAGQSMAGKRVLEAGGDEVRVLVRSFHRFGYEPAEMWDVDAVRDGYRWADVVVIHNDPAVFELVRDIPVRRSLIVHHHGSRFRNNPGNLFRAAEEIGARQVVSTVDLLLSVPPGKRADWFPQVVDVELMQRIRAENYTPPRRPIVAHAPTNRRIKGTRYVQRAMGELRTEADFLLIQHQTWARCLALKAQSDIFVDQLHLGYGNNAIEAWAMGLPVLASAPTAIKAKMRKKFGGELPFYAANADLLARGLRPFVRDPELRAEWAARGMAHVERFHAPAAWAERARSLYEAPEMLVAA